MIYISPKKNKAWFVALLMLLSISACSTPETRIKEHQAQFNTYHPDVQNMIRAGQVRKGFTRNQVYMALGNPYKRSDEKWTYAKCHYKTFYIPKSEWEYKNEYKKELKRHNKKIEQGKDDIFVPPSRIKEDQRCRHYATRVLDFNSDHLTGDESQTGYIWLDPDYE